MVSEVLSHFSLLIYSISFAMCFAALALCIACWIKEREVWQLKTVAFIIYFTFLFFLEAIFFYYSHIMKMSPKTGCISKSFSSSGTWAMPCCCTIWGPPSTIYSVSGGSR